MTEYKLSIIVPTYNLENRIENAFNSIKNQTLGFNNIEVIFVDDNSIDNTYKIITEFSENYENVKVFKTDMNSKFAGKPRNIGLENSTSKYLLFLDGDDQLLINSCEVLLNNMKSNGCDISIGAHINYYDNHVQEHNPPLYSGRNEVFENSNDLNLLSITPAISAKLFNKELLIKNNIKFSEGIPGQDLLFLLEVLLNSRKVNVLNNNYIYYRNINNNSISLNPNEEYIYGLIKAYAQLCDLFEKFSIDFNVQLTILQRHLGFFSMQILRALNKKKMTSKSLHEIFNSKLYDNFKNKSIFKNNNEFMEYFKFLEDGNYSNARTKIDSINLNFNTINDYSNLKNKIKGLEEQNTQLNDEIKSNKNTIIQLRTMQNNLVTKNKIITKDNTNLKEQNERLINKNENIAKQNNTFINNNTKLKDENKTITHKNKILEEENENITKENEIIINNNITLKKQNDRLTEQNNNLNNEFIDLKHDFDDIKVESEKIINSNIYLKEENSNLKNELDEIKSSRLWKLKNKF